jgi:GNAT superfamily N-acetyltransferase
VKRAAASQTRQVTEVEIVRLRPADWVQYREVRLAALTQAPDAFASTLAGEETMAPAEWRARLSRRSSFAARAAPGLVGTAAGIPGDAPGHAELVGMWVHPDWRHQGIGGRLISAVIGWAADGPYRALDLWLAVGNEAAEALYARLGFVRTGATVPMRADEPDRLKLEMTRPL